MGKVKYREIRRIFFDSSFDFVPCIEQNGVSSWLFMVPGLRLVDELFDRKGDWYMLYVSWYFYSGQKGCILRGFLDFRILEIYYVTRKKGG